MTKRPRKRPGSQRGSILIWVALFMTVMLAFVALGVDGAKLMATKTQLQNAADAGALAGAAEVDPISGTIVQAQAVPAAQAAAASNKAFIAGPAPVLNAVVSFPTSNRVQVEVTRSGETSIITHIAQVVGVRSLTASATAVAEASPPSCVYGLRPLGVGNATIPFTYVVGQEYVLHGGFGPGNYQHLDFSRIQPPLDPACTTGPCADVSSSGGDLLRCMLEHGMGCCLKDGEMIGVQTGVSSGPVGQAVDYLFNNDTVQEQYPASQTNTYPVYDAAGGNDSRVVTIPLVQFIPTPCVGNNCWAKVNGFAAFFLKRRFNAGQKEFYGEFIKYSVPGEGTGGNGTDYSVRLVR